MIIISQSGETADTLAGHEIADLKAEMLTLPEKAEEVLKNEEVVKDFASKNYGESDMFYIGRGLDYIESQD